MALVSVSREEGSWGGDVARDLADRLGYRLLDKKALLEEAEAYGGISPTAPELLEKRPGLWERLDQERRRYNVLLRTVVYNVALRDNVVFLGRGTGMLFADVDRALRVLFTAPVPVRVARIMERGAGGRSGPLTREQAEEIVRRSDRDRAAYFRYLFQKDWLDPFHHSIVINTDVMEVPAATDLLVRMIESGAYDITGSSRERLEQLARASTEESQRLVGSRR
ncbi:MAG: cytidylate kinase-like family protein [Chloroflexota bacterium]|nr:cytidylate kinase-like family protein [Chloroflexota bacterium]